MYDGARIPERHTKFRDATDYCVKKYMIAAADWAVTRTGKQKVITDLH